MTETTLTLHQSPHLMPAMTMADAVQRFNALSKFAKEIMRDGIDYGNIPGTDKPTLLKPGAEKLTTFFGLSVRYELIEKEEDWTGKQHEGEPFFYYWFRCVLKRGDLLIAEADGSCNSWESKYRYRWADYTCPKCEQTGTIIKGKEQYGGGWLCWNKRGGCGAKFKDGAPEIEKQPRGRIPNPDPADQVNTIKKMAQKRALVAATLLAVNASEYFTQDLEDLDITAINGEYRAVENPGPDWSAVPDDGDEQPMPRSTVQAERPLEPEALRRGMRARAHWAKNNGDYTRVDAEPITDKQIGFVASRLEALFTNVPADLQKKARYDVLGYFYGVDSTKKLSKAEASALIEWAEDVDAATQEAARILAEVAIAAGQQEMELEV